MYKHGATRIFGQGIGRSHSRVLGRRHTGFWTESALFLIGILAFLPVLFLSISHQSWNTLLIGIALIAIGIFVFPYFLAIMTPVLFEYVLFSFTLNDAKESGYSFSMVNLVFDFFKETGLFFLVFLIICLLIARSSKRQPL